MKPKTMILMVVAVGCGLGASYMTSRLLAERNKPPEEVLTVPVLVAKARVPGWQPIKEPEKLFEVRQFPQDVAPKKALSNIAELKDQRLNKPLDEGKPVTQDDLLTKEQSDISSLLQPGQRAVAIKVTAESLAGGFVLPGARVDVICTTRGNNDPHAKVVLQHMLVLAVDTQDVRNPEQKSIIGQTVTLAATPNEATRISLAQAIGELRLMPKGNGDNVRIGQVTTRISDLDKPLNPGDGGTPTEETAPSAPSGTAVLPVIPEDNKPAPIEEPKVTPEKARKRHVMIIMNGSQREKAIFTEGEDEDVSDGGATAPAAAPKAEEPKEEEQPAPKPAAKPAAPKPAAPKPAAPPAGPSSPFGKTPRTKTPPPQG